MVHISRAVAVPACIALLTAIRTAAADDAFAVAGAQGFGLRAGDDFKLDLRTALATDARVFLGAVPGGVNDRSTAAVRTAALQLDATVHAKLRVLMLANAIDPRAPVTDAWADLAIAPALHVRVGKFPFPISSERLTPPLSQPFVGSSAAGLLLPARDTGLQLYGSWRALDWNLALVNGALAGQPGDADTDGGKELVARAFAWPLGRAPGRALGLGVGASWGRHRGTATAPGLTALRSYGGQTFFAYRGDPGVVADGELVRVVPHATIAAGPVGVQLDAVLAWEDVANTRVAMRAASAIATVALTGEPAQPLAFVVPRRPLRGADPGPGAILLVAGFGGVRVDDAAFAAAADPAAAAARFTVLGGGVKWYPVAGIAVFVDYGHQWFGAARGAMPRVAEDTLVARLQLIL